MAAPVESVQKDGSLRVCVIVCKVSQLRITTISVLVSRRISTEIAESDIHSDTVRLNTDNSTPRQPLSEGDIDMAGLDHVPLKLRTNIYKTFVNGYIIGVLAVGQIVREGGIPTTSAIRQRMLTGRFERAYCNEYVAVAHYFQKGGLADYPLDCILHSNREQSELGDDTFRETFEEDLDAKPECANDREYDLVRSKLGLSALIRGPYYSWDNEEGLEDAMDESDW